MPQKQCSEVEYEIIPVEDGVIVLSGYSISMKVEKGFLCLKDGLCGEWREGRYSRPTCKIKRVVILGHDGFISLAALKWLFDIGAGIIQIGLDGEIILASGPHREHITSKRAQYAAAGNSDGLEVARYLMSEKLQGQCLVLRKFHPNETFTYQNEPHNIVWFLKTYTQKAKTAGSISEVLDIEGLTSFAYHDIISKTCLQFEKADRNHIPDHWLTFGPRHSFIDPKRSRNATTPGNAMLNYLFAILHAETCIALLRVGLDPYAGIIHCDNVYRASFAYDVMEVARPAVEMWLLDFVKSRTFSRKDFYQKPDGGVRITLRLTPQLAGTAGLWREALLPHVKHTAETLRGSKNPR